MQMIMRVLLRGLTDITEEDSLGNSEYESSIEDAQYLPQKYIEVVCNDIGEVFQSEIDKVIFPMWIERKERQQRI